MYNWYLTINGTETEVFPNYPESVSKNFTRESEQEFLRASLSAKLKFLSDDFDLIESQDHETRFDLRLAYDKGDYANPNYFNGYFYKSNCTFNQDDRKVEVEPIPSDDYQAVLDGLDSEFNIIELAPKVDDITGRKRPIIQIYPLGTTKVTDFYGGNHAEKDLAIDPVTSHTDLINIYKFARGKRIFTVVDIQPTDPTYFDPLSPDVTGDYDPETKENANYYFQYVNFQSSLYRWELKRKSDNVTLFDGFASGSSTPNNLRGNIFYPTNPGATGATGQFYIAQYDIYFRYLTDLSTVRGTPTFDRPQDDIVETNLNYRKVIGYDIDTVFHYPETQTEPSKFGKSRVIDVTIPEQYYKELRFSIASGLNDPIPITPFDWQYGSLWFYTTMDIEYTEFIDGQDIVFPNCMRLDSVIQKLLEAVGSDLTFLPDVEHSEFLYSEINPVTAGFNYQDFDSGGIFGTYQGNLSHYIAPKSNIVVGGSSGPRGGTRSGFREATVAKITLRGVFDMLRNTKRLFWFIDNGKLRIEHIRYFQNGGSYSTIDRGLIDLTTMIEPKTKKPWAYGKNVYSFANDELPERIEYKWMDKVTLPFDGFPVIINSKIAKSGFVDRRDVLEYISDFDFSVMNPNEVNLDGFMLLDTITHESKQKLPYVQITYDYNRRLIIQNGFLSNIYMVPEYQQFDMPDENVNINLENLVLTSNISRKKIQENVVFPSQIDPETISLIKTGLGSGVIDKISVSLYSRIVTASLRHDTKS